MTSIDTWFSVINAFQNYAINIPGSIDACYVLPLLQLTCKTCDTNSLVVSGILHALYRSREIKLSRTIVNHDSTCIRTYHFYIGLSDRDSFLIWDDVASSVDEREFFRHDEFVAYLSSVQDQVQIVEEK
jgi:hypothetical protein